MSIHSGAAICLQGRARAAGLPLACLPSACVSSLPSRGPWAALASRQTAMAPLQALAAPAVGCRRQLRPCCAAPREAAGQQHAAAPPGVDIAAELGILLRGGMVAPAAGLLALLLSAGSALAADGMAAYNPEGGSETLKAIAGVVYIIVVAVFFLGVFRRRAQKATSERIASVADAAAVGGTAGDDSDSEDEEEQRAKAAAAAEDVTPVQAAIGATQAGLIAWLLFQLCTNVDAYFDRQTLPDAVTAYTAHNIAVLVQTVCRGLVYLMTFIFGANATGLAGLSLQLMFFPEMDQGSGPQRKKAPALPRVSVTDDMGTLRKAFKEAERMGQKEAEKQIRRSSRDEAP